MRIHLIDNGLERYGGHHDHIDRGVKAAAAARGVEISIYCLERPDPALAAELGARPLLRESMYRPLNSDPYDGAFQDFVGKRRMLIEDLHALDGEVAADDLVLLPTVSTPLLAAVGGWLLDRRRPAKVAALFHDAPAQIGPGSLAGALLRSAVRSCASAKAPMWLAATNEALAETLEPVVRGPLRVARVNHFVLPIDAADGGGPEPRIGMLGDSRPEKETALVAAIEAVGGLSRPLRLVAHRHVRAPQDGDPVDAALRAEARVELIDGWLDEPAFARLLSSLDAVLLCHDPAAFRERVSGVLGMAAGYGRPVIAPAGTWMAERIARGHAAGVCYDAPDRAAVSAALETLLDDLPAYRAKALEIAGRVRLESSAERLVDRLLRWANG